MSNVYMHSATFIQKSRNGEISHAGKDYKLIETGQTVVISDAVPQGYVSATPSVDQIKSKKAND